VNWTRRGGEKVAVASEAALHEVDCPACGGTSGETYRCTECSHPIAAGHETAGRKGSQ
jgi:DNA-directed RNA polymerase subunit RPC12/RpoP